MYVEIRIKGTLKQDWSDWFGGIIVSNQSDGETILSGKIPDQSALLGLLNRIHGLNLSCFPFHNPTISLESPPSLKRNRELG